jgi:hypothetical protein
MPEEIPTDTPGTHDRIAEQRPGDMVPIIERVAGTMLCATAEIVPESVTEAEKPANLDELRREIMRSYPGMHPYLPAEQTPKTVVRKFYDRSESKASIVAWRGIDVLLSKRENDTARQLRVIKGDLDAAYAATVPTWRRMKRVRVGATMPGEAEWNDIAMLRASLPAFADRLASAPVSDESAAAVYRAIIKEVMPFIQDAGILSQTMAAALLARRGGAAFAFPCSLREESTNLRNDDGQLFNHDLYQLSSPDLVKTPLQIKTKQSSNNPSTYDPGVIQVPLLDWLAPVILGRPGMTVTDSARFLEHIRTAFLIPTPSGQAILDVAAKYFDDRIREQATLQGIRPA